MTLRPSFAKQPDLRHTVIVHRDTGFLTYARLSGGEDELDRSKVRTHYAYRDEITIAPHNRSRREEAVDWLEKTIDKFWQD